MGRRNAIGARPFRSSTKILLMCNLFVCLMSQRLRLSNAAKLSRPHKTSQQLFHNNKPSDASRALFNEIIEILGADTMIPNRCPPGFLFLFETPHFEVGFRDQQACIEVACENATEDVGVLEDAHLGNMDEEYVSQVVGEIIEIIRAENCFFFVEERLENLNYGFNSEVFDMVLKRCFKMPQKLALRVFHWLKVNDRFRHTTRT
ncbi:hypothetical protein Fmac_008763 [Flemingia macrophylla]|uniref:Uncharacterized protein n=1 Tax=Flemingia macrophylla TaxID=520843 RepID=A0ABD1MYE4_9FABA